MLILFHFLLQAKHLPLQLIPQAGQGVSDVVGQLGVQLLLQIRCPALVCHVSVGRVGQEELSFGSHCSLDVLLAGDVLLATVHHWNVSSAERIDLVVNYVSCIRPFVHQVQFCENPNGAQTLRINRLCHGEGVGSCQVSVGRSDSQDETGLLADELHDHVLDLLLDVHWLVPDCDPRQARQVDQGDVQN